MAQSPQLRIQRNSEALKAYGLSRSTYYARIADGLIPAPFPLGERAVGQLEHETQAVISAMAAGFTKSELQDLVASLVADRKSLALAIISEVNSH